MTMRIRVEDLRVHTRIGVGDAERSAPQPVLIDVILQIQPASDQASDELDATVDYASVVSICAEVAEQKERKLLERLAEDIAAAVSGLARVGDVTVRVAKEVPPVPEDVGRIAVEVERKMR